MSEQALVRASPTSHWVPRQRTALHRAAMVGDAETLSALIQGGCALDLQDRDGNTALHEASWHGFSPCVKLLVKAGADVNVRNKAGNIALHLASQNAHVPSTRLLLLGGSSVNAKNNVGETCLHVAARYDNRDVVKILITSLCVLSEKNQRGDTALHIAATLNHKKTVQLLLAAGIDANLRNNAGRTALDKARDNDHNELAVLLAKAPQVHCFLRRRTVKRQRERQRSQSACRVETEPNQVAVVEQGSSSATEDVLGNEQPEQSKDFKTHLQNKVTSPICHDKTRKREEKDKIWVEKKAKNHDKKQLSFEDSDKVDVQFGGSYQIYTLFRDKDGNVKQSPAHGCHCKPLLKKLERELQSTQEEMRLQILNIQQEVNNRMAQMERCSRKQIKVAYMINQATVAAERRHVMYRMKQQAAQGLYYLQDLLFCLGCDVLLCVSEQAAVRGGMKRWCMSQLQTRDAPITPTNAPYSKLVHSPSAGQSCGGSDLESVPLLSVLSGDSSSSLATYVNIAPSWSSCSLGSEQSSGNYFEMMTDRSPDDYENSSLFPPFGSHGWLSSVSPLRPPVEVQDSGSSAVVTVKGEGFMSSSLTSSDITPRWVPPQGPRRQELVRVGHYQDRTMEVYKDHPPAESTCPLERSDLHAVEVTQRFFETVSTQLELWYERKILEVERQTEVQAQKDKQELLKQISTLEAELQSLRTNESTDCTTQDQSAELEN
ncbi:ankyrin repeat domain-containing protein 6 [Eucyclogobius newberryi]|uniref:ankyrin repeat domain-containing protein 6 n=1 Tax=Eucyclogobius newberryi TaxID=166745 RepID=UPI003B5CBB9C